MSVKLRLKRMGRKKRPFYRLVAIDSRKRRDGLEIERLGWYNPVHKDFSYEMKEDRILYWLQEGAQPSDTVSGLFRRSGLSYKWDLLKKGVKDDKIESLLSEWSQKQKAKEELRLEKKKSKKLKSAEISPEAEAAAEEPAVEEAPEAEEADPEVEEAAPEAVKVDGKTKTDKK